MPNVAASDRATNRPYFFLSYAHAEAPQAGGQSDIDREVIDFFHLLCKHLRQLTVIPSDASPGYVDTHTRIGTQWHPNLFEALANCHVFVPLYSPRYFESRWCGEEWGAFELRQAAAQSNSEDAFPAIVPVLWTGTANLKLPRCASQVQYANDWLGDRYKDDGIYGLMIVDETEYRKAAFYIAKTIAGVVASTDLPACDPAILVHAKNAFESE